MQPVPKFIPKIKLIDLSIFIPSLIFLKMILEKPQSVGFFGGSGGTEKLGG